MLATVPFHIGLFFPGIRHFLIIRMFRLIRTLKRIEETPKDSHEKE